MAEEKKHKVLDQEIELPAGVTVSYVKGVFTLKGPKGELSKKLQSPILDISIVDGNILIKPKDKSGRRENRMIKTFRAHLRNMIKGVTNGFTYKMKICSGHFPMNVSVTGNEFIVKNFIGEKVPRKVPLFPNVKVSIDGHTVTIDSIDKEAAGMMAAAIEQLTRRPGFDTRIFQDGIYIVDKGGKELR